MSRNTFISKINSLSPEKWPIWKVFLGTITASYLLNNSLLLAFLNGPEPLARMYTRNFFRATYFLTSLDAGFLTAMKIRPKPLRDVLSILFSLVYLFFPDSADDKVRKYRTAPTAAMMRVSWEKGMNPILRLVSYMDRGSLGIRKNIELPRPALPSPSSFPGGYQSMGGHHIKARLYFAGSESELSRATQVLLHIPGGGFATMSPECHDDSTSGWARQTKIPIVSINYGKAPEFPYPWAIEECFDAYRTLVETNGSVIGIKATAPLRIVISGDSAGGNIAVGVVFKCLESRDVFHIHPPAGCLLVYPCLSFEMGCWMGKSSMSLVRAESSLSLSLQSLVKTKEMVDTEQSPLAVPEAPRGIDVLKDKVDRSSSWFSSVFRLGRPRPSLPIPSSLSMTSRVSFFADRIIQLEMLRAMALLYLGTSPVPLDIDQDYYISPILAPDELLARFPKTYLLCGEKDPLVDDSVLFAGRLRAVKERAHREWKSLKRRVFATESSPDGPAPAHAASSTPSQLQEELSTHVYSHPANEMVKMKILEGLSHAILLMCTFLPEAVQATQLTASWITDLFDTAASESLAHQHQDAEELNDSLTDFMIQEMGSGSRVSSPVVRNEVALSKAMAEVSELKLLERRRKGLSSALYNSGAGDNYTLGGGSGGKGGGRT